MKNLALWAVSALFVAACTPKAEQPTELFTSAALTRFLAFEAGDGSTCVVRVLELPAHELLSDGEVSRSLSFLPRFFAYWHECVDMKKPPEPKRRGRIVSNFEFVWIMLTGTGGIGYWRNCSA